MVFYRGIRLLPDPQQVRCRLDDALLGAAVNPVLLTSVGKGGGSKISPSLGVGVVPGFLSRPVVRLRGGDAANLLIDHVRELLDGLVDAAEFSQTLVGIA